MAHFALIENGVVTAVTVVDNDKCGDLPFPDSEPVGQAYLAECGLDGHWLQTSYNNSFRQWFATVGCLYDEAADVFYPASPGDGWTLDTTDWVWVNLSGQTLPPRKVS